MELTALPKSRLPAVPMGRGRQSLPAVSTFAGGGGSEGSRRSRVTMSQDELGLHKLPTAEAVRQALIQRTGSLRLVYLSLDVNRTGKVSSADFERGLANLNIYGSPIAKFLSIESLFKELACGAVELSLHEVLGYVPIEKSTKMQGVSDTKTQWFEYHNKTSAMKSRLIRGPAWKEEQATANVLPPINDQEPKTFGEREQNDAGTNSNNKKQPLNWEQAECVRRRRRQDLRKQFREARQEMNMREKQDLVGGNACGEDAIEIRENEHRRVERHRQRIEGAIRDCSRSRQQLVDMQKMLSNVSDQGKPALDNDFKSGMKMALFGGLPKLRLEPPAAREPDFQPPIQALKLKGDESQTPISPSATIKKVRIDPCI